MNLEKLEQAIQESEQRQQVALNKLAALAERMRQIRKNLDEQKQDV